MPTPADLADRLRAALPPRPLHVTWRGRELTLARERILAPANLYALYEQGAAVWAALTFGDLDADYDEAVDVLDELADQIDYRDPPIMLDLGGEPVRVNVAALRHEPHLATLARGRAADWAQAIAVSLPRMDKPAALAFAERVVAAAEARA